ncbi:MAG: tRNA lysidine(34) synthetase TilS [Sphingobacteriales bacterium]|nr:MAG: tRNA lysidine(34) synthetase TilS [Sphingobacteriales bacterium]
MMLQQFTRFLFDSCRVQKNNQLLLAVSGGVDSVVLCELMFQSKIPFGIAHCNFQLRGKAADDDETFVAQLADKYQVSYYSVRFDTLQFAGDNQVSVQMAARALRYDWLESIREENGYTFIATAHHQNDIAETMLFNLTKGTGIAGLHGILPKTGKLVRPMLFLSKINIEDFALQHQLAFRTDESNAETKYVRNKIRHTVIPALKEINPNLEETYYQNSLRFQEIEQVYRTGIDFYRKKLFTGSEKEYFISIGKLLKIAPLKSVLYELLRPFDFNAAQVEMIIETLQQESGKMVYSNTHQILKDRKFLILSPISSKDTSYSLIEKSVQSIEKSDLQLLFNYLPAEGYNISSDTNLAGLDVNKIEFPLVLRRWKMGDYFYPFGMNLKKKKLKRFFTDLKLSLIQKDKIWILADNKGRIVWVVGYRIDERFKITSNTRQVCQITAFRQT